MSEQKPEVNPEDLPNIPELRDLIESGYGKVTINDHRPGQPITGFHFLSGEDMEAMGESERIRLGVEAHYQFGLAHGLGASSKDDTAPASE
jgi:hypothetical protein